MAAGDWKALLAASQTGDLAAMRYFISEGVNPNYQHPEFLTTPLIEAIRHEQLEAVKYLLESGSDPDLREGFSADTARTIAKKTKNKAIILVVKQY